MIHVSTLAQEVLRKTLEKSEFSDQDVTFRLRVTRDKSTGRKRFGLVYDRVREGDYVVEYEGRNVLLISESIATRLADFTLHVVSTERGRRLKFQRTASLLKRADDT